MYTRLLKSPTAKSFFLFGPRGTGKTTWLKISFPKGIYLDLLESRLFTELTANPQKLETLIPDHFKDWVILDEVQRIPTLLNEVHRLIESKNLKFILTGSSARKLRRESGNLLAGRALTYYIYPLTALELGDDFSIEKSIRQGSLPSIFKEEDPERFLNSFVSTYLEQEIQQEGLTRNLGNFARFLEAASFSHGQVLNTAEVARDCHVNRKVVESYFLILYELRLAYLLPIFKKRTKRRLISHPKFYFFDAGVYQTIRPKDLLDTSREKEGVALEGLLLHEIKALNDYLNLGYELYFWRTGSQMEVDFIIHGKRGLKAIEVKRSTNIEKKDLKGLKAFAKDYPETELILLYTGDRKRWIDGITCLPVETFLKKMPDYL